MVGGVRFYIIKFGFPTRNVRCWSEDRDGGWRCPPIVWWLPDTPGPRSEICSVHFWNSGCGRGKNEGTLDI
jgi:hypothetical protein